MQNINPQALFANADNLLLTASEEINRTEEDVVTHLICHNSRLSIGNYFMGYLLEKGEHLPYPTTLEVLLDKCKALEPSFHQIDLGPIHCRADMHDGEYCLDLETVDDCFLIAKQIQALIRQLGF